MAEETSTCRVDKKVIETLNKIGEDIDTISFSDIDAWKDICAEFEMMIRDIPDEMSGLFKLLSFCLEGLRGISDKSASDLLSLIEAISEALNASGQYLLGNADREGLVNDAGRALAGALGKDPDEWDQPIESEMAGVEPVDAEATPSLSLDDAAAMLIQLEADDISGLAGLRESLNGIACDESYPEPCRKNVVQAVQKIEGIVGGSVSDAGVTLAEAGGFIEEAMNVILDRQKEESTVPDEEAAPEDELAVPAEEAVPEEEVAEVPEEAVPDQEAAGQAAEESGTDYMPEDADLDLLAEFITECRDLISNAEVALLSLENDPEDMDAVGTVFRAFHTIKGTSGFLNLTLTSEMGHHAESLLSRVRDREIRYGGGYADVTLRALDMLKDLIESVEGALGGQPLLKPEAYDDLMLILANPEEAGISDEFEEMPESASRIGEILVAQGKAEKEQVEECDVRKGETPIGVELVKEKAASVTDVAQALRTQKQIRGGKHVVESSVRVGTERLDRLIDMVGELVVAHSMVAQDDIVVDSNHHELLKKVAHTTKIVRQLQDLGMSMRMIPLKSTFQKMARLVRDLSRKAGKDVDFVTEGEDTEIDRNMVDIIKDPLVHMVRNSVDHGIEMPDIREKIGKPKNGTVKLSAYHSAGSVVVEIEDDGKGLDREAIMAKAQERGLVSEGVSITDREAFNLIFEPGFSTAAVVTEVSGRGVGMDVVKKNIEALRGQVEIQSKPGKGSIFQMRLPLTLAIIDGMVVGVGREIYVIPTVSIIRSIKPEPEDFSTVLNRGEMLSIQGKLIPLFRLANLFSIEDAEQDISKGIVVVIEDSGHQAGLVLEELMGRQQVVIKTLGEAMQNIPGISGGAIMPDGRVGLILDVGGLVRLANGEAGEGEIS